MSEFEVPEAIICSPFAEPDRHWYLQEGTTAELRAGRRPSVYYYGGQASDDGAPVVSAIELKLVTLIRGRLKQWRGDGYPGATRTTTELLTYWRRDGRVQRLFFAQLEAAETVIFLTQARRDYLQGIEVPLDTPTERQQADGARGFVRYACKMATGAGKTTVMGMLAAWSILNKVHDRSNARYSDTVLVVCPNVTIRSRLSELDPRHGEASLHRTRDLVPAHLMPDLAQGFVLVTNWHVFEPQVVQAGGVSAKVLKTGVRRRIRERIYISDKTTFARGKRYLTTEEFGRQLNAGLLEHIGDELDLHGNLKCHVVEAERWIESETALLARVLGRDIGAKQNLLVFNDEAHHAYRIRRDEGAADEDALEEADEDLPSDEKEATVWVEGCSACRSWWCRSRRTRRVLHVHRRRGIPDFIVRIANAPDEYLSLETKGFDDLAEVKAAAAECWVSAVNADGHFGQWRFAIARSVPAVREILNEEAATRSRPGPS